MSELQAVQEIQVSKMRKNRKATALQKLRLLSAYDYASGSRARMYPERKLASMSFSVHKFNNRSKPQDLQKILIIPSFWEFGVETIGMCYCLPQIIHANPDCYIIVVGWHGRSFLYSKMADEYWELSEDHQWLREYSDAFRNDSRNISNLEVKLSQYGRVVNGSSFSQMCVHYFCVECKHGFVTHNHINTKCQKCNGDNLVRPLFGDLSASKKRFVSVPTPSMEKHDAMRRFVHGKPIAIFARNRLRYGRNLSINFYQKLINLIKEMGYQPIWMGEKQSVHACPDPTIVDFTSHPESNDLECTLALLSMCNYTMQYYTASTRLAAMVKTPWILFESADQLVGNGQEGMRIILTTEQEKKKLVIANFQRLLENEDEGIRHSRIAIEEMDQGNHKTIVAMVDNSDMVRMNMVKLDYWWRHANK